MLPGAPSGERSSRITPLGKVVEHLHKLESDAATFWVTWTDLPRLALFLSGDERIYQKVRRETLEEPSVSQIAFRSVTVGDHAGRELLYIEAGADEQDRSGRLQTYLIGNRLYVFDSVAHEDVAPRAVERFFSSIAFGGPL